jgi:hypothetical protein
VYTWGYEVDIERGDARLVSQDRLFLVDWVGVVFVRISQVCLPGWVGSYGVLMSARTRV